MSATPQVRVIAVGRTPPDLAGFLAASEAPLPVRLELPDDLPRRLDEARAAIADALAAGVPVYGLNTGLGARLDERIAGDTIAAFQHQILAGRATGVGPALAPGLSRSALLARIISAARGRSGISPALLRHLCDVFEAGLAPVVPELGSIGSSDLVTNAHMGLALTGHGRLWREGESVGAGEALASCGLAVPPLEPKDAMVLVSHSSFTVARAAHALKQGMTSAAALRSAIVLSCEAYRANRSIFDDTINRLRRAPGQREAARWFREALADSTASPRRTQDALSFRVVATVTGALEHALAHAVDVLEGELGGIPDSPVMAGEGGMFSTSNFHTPALSLALENLSLAVAMAASGSVHRMQRMMDPEFSGLPRFLSPRGGASAGMVALQKTAAALLGEIRHDSRPVDSDPVAVSLDVEDQACMTPHAAAKLARQLGSFRLLIGMEGLVAAQALDLGSPGQAGSRAAALHGAIRDCCPRLDADRPLGEDVETAARALEARSDAGLVFQ